FADIAHVDAGGTAAINALASHGITLGTTATTFAPDSNVTRAQMATFLSRFMKIAKTAAGGAIATTIATAKYNYTDIAGVTPEESESIIRGYNLGLHGASCVVDALVGTCAGSTAYRPADDMTRAEMASMLTAALNHTNARPAGVSIQTTSANLTVGSVTVAINVRNADFSAQANTLVDEFYQLHNDLLTAVAPFHAILGSCTGVTKTRGGALCVVDSGDHTSDVRGNIVGTAQTTSAYKTANWWVHTGAAGSTFVNGTTATFDTYSINWGAASTLVAADRGTLSQSGTNTLSTSKAAASGITLQDGINTWAGASRTFSVTLSSTASPLATILPGYSIKVATVTQDNLGNIANTTAYYPVDGITASFTTTCPADTSALNTDWWVAIQHTITMGTALGGNGRPGAAADPLAASTVFGTGVTDTGTAGNVGVTCDDEARAYAGGGATAVETLAIGENNFTLSTAGSLASVTATAYDQYGDGIAGTGVEITSVRTTAAGVASTVVAATLSTGAGGVASLSAVVCATGERDVAYSITDPTGAYIDAITAAVPGALAVEGTTIYCSSAATDGAFGDVAAVAEVQTIALAGTGLGGTFALTYSGATAATVAFGSAHGVLNGLLDGLSSLAAGAA
ncbi:MAG TPA: S-layer homology domain-containing protein, partial [Planctomycetes bacterium]|nr:S-layer homology domain-containing protein [Planctomycetota bacterium]